MKLFLLTSVTMIAFAANSVLNRIGLADGVMDPMAFAIIRLASGAIALCLLVLIQGRIVPIFRRARIGGAASLALYMIGFSLAYRTLDAGVGALILFGGVQVTIFAVLVFRGQEVSMAKWQGAGVAMIGLAYLLLPGAQAPDFGGAMLMAAAAIGWGAYTLAGRVELDPLGATAGNFVIATLTVAGCQILLSGMPPISLLGTTYAVISGVLTSAMGYALWYTILPRLEASIAGIAQLTVPVIALAGGIAMLGEALTLSFVIASLLVLGGVAWSLLRA